MTIFVTTDFSESSRPALQFGARLARRRGEMLVLFHCVDLAADDEAWRVLVEAPEQIEQSAAAEAQERLEAFLAETLPEEERPEQVGYHVALGNPIQEILKHSKKFSNPLILAGTLGKSRMREIFLGSTARRLVRQATKPVILVPPEEPAKSIERVVVALDLSPVSGEILRYGVAQARAEGAKLSVVHGFSLPEVAALQNAMVNVTAEMDRIVEGKRVALKKLIEKEGVASEVESIEIIEMPPAAAILTAAEDPKAQLIVIGTHGRRGWSRFFLGNTAERILRRAPCPVFLVPLSGEEKSEDLAT